MALPSLTACLIAVMSWHSAASIIGVIGLVGATAILLLLRSGPMERAARTPANRHEAGEVRDRSSLLHNGFPLLLAIGVIDSATRMGFLTFLPFLLRAKGAGVPEIGVGLTLLLPAAPPASLSADSSARGLGCCRLCF